jgi:hypothetical protein
MSSYPLPCAALSAVAGGAGRALAFGFGPFSYRTEESNYAVCARTVGDMTSRAYPDSRPWYQLWGRDTNAATRERALENDLAVCTPALQK